MKYTATDYQNVKAHSTVGSNLENWLRLLDKKYQKTKWQLITYILFILYIVILFTPLIIIK